MCNNMQHTNAEKTRQLQALRKSITILLMIIIIVIIIQTCYRSYVVIIIKLTIVITLSM